VKARDLLFHLSLSPCCGPHSLSVRFWTEGCPCMHGLAMHAWARGDIGESDPAHSLTSTHSQSINGERPWHL